MRVILLILLLAACVSSGLNPKLLEKLKRASAKAILNTTELRDIHGKIDHLKPEIKEMLKLSSKQKASLAELVEKIIKIKKDHVNPKGDSIEEINHKSKMGGLLYQGDIVLTKSQADEIAEDTVANSEKSRAKRQAFLDRRYPNTRWENGVDYYFHSNATEDVKRVFLKAVELWRKDTCIDFRENATAADRVCVLRSSGLCFSSVGKVGGLQNLSLDDGCESVGTAAHEIGHTLGFFHTHSRHDRDKYIQFIPANVNPRYMDEFTKQTTMTNENYNIPYDYGSVMHYGTTMASFNGKATMLTKDDKYVQTLGSPFISFYDLIMMNFHYGCNKICTKDKSRARCSNGGTAHPRNCSICLCPTGYGGKDCKERPTGCGQEYDATSEAKILEDTVGQPEKGHVDREDYDKCIYWIKAPSGKKIEIEIVGMSGGLAVDGCQYGGVEIKTHKDQKLTGYRFCAPEDVGVKLVSKRNIVPIITYNRLFMTKTILKYRIGAAHITYRTNNWLQWI